MNEILAGAAAFSLAFILWGLGKQPSSGLFQKNASKIKPTSFHDFPALVKSSEKSNLSISITSEAVLELPKNSQEKILLQKKIQKLIAAGPVERLQAVKLADWWGNHSVLPILLRGLKDSDSRVVEVAARALSKYKGLPSLKALQKEESRRPPRNVALTL